MKLKEIIDIIENEYPPELAYEWDNSGLFYGSPDAKIAKAVVTLDITPEVINQAIINNAQLVIAHHPIVMSGVKKLSDNSMASKMICDILKNDIAVYSAHTNMDTAANGINQHLANMFELENIEVMETDKPYPDCGLGRIGNLKRTVMLSEFCNMVKDKLNTPFVRVCGENREIKRVAFASGSCSEYVPTALKKGADVIFTADMKYHNCIEYVYDGIAIIAAGHYPTEIIAQDMFYNLLKDTGIEIIYAKTDDIFQIK